MKSPFFFALAALTAFAGGAQAQNPSVNCAWNGSNYQPYDSAHQRWVGKSGYGFTNQSKCIEMAAAASYYSVCNWNGDNYQPYSLITGNAIGKEDYGFTDSANCAKVTAADRAGAVCNWNGDNYQPYSTITGVAIGKEDHGFTQLGSCTETTQANAGSAVCNWNGDNYQPYAAAAGAPIGRLDYGFTEFGSCKDVTNAAPLGLACNWDGSGYSAYSVFDVSTPIYQFPSKTTCTAYTQTNGAPNLPQPPIVIPPVVIPPNPGHIPGVPNPPAVPVGPGTGSQYSCTVITSQGTYSGVGVSQGAATAQARSNCIKVETSFRCNAAPVSCQLF